MLLTFTLLLLLVLLSRFLEERFKLPFALGAITLAYVADSGFHLEILGEHFPEVVYLMLPLILIPDVLGVSRAEIRENRGALLYLALVAVVVSIGAAAGITYLVLPENAPGFAALLALFAPLMATDVVSVSSIFARFRLPERLKVYAEGESLFNDIVAMTLFFFIALPLLEGQTGSLPALQLTLAKTVLLSLAIGVLVGLAGYYLFKFFNESLEQFLTIYLMATLAFALCEHYGASGILGVVVAILLFRYLFDKEGHYKRISLDRLYRSFNHESASERNFRAYRKEAHYIGLFANGVVFIAIASVVDLGLMAAHAVEIVAVFLLTTWVRFMVIAPMMAWKDHPMRWTTALTLGGMKGGLAIIMAFALPEGYAYREEFMAIIVGVVILSLFVNTLALTLFLRFQADAFALDKASEIYANPGDHYGHRRLKHTLAVDPDSGAYNALLFEEMIEKQIAEAQRYHTDFVLLAFDHPRPATVARDALPLLRQSDLVGRLGNQRYAILAGHTDLEAAMNIAQKLRRCLNGRHIGIAEYAPGDTLGMLYDKLEDALASEKPIDVEV